jgi:DNA-binding response OmpR family regulator
MSDPSQHRPTALIIEDDDKLATIFNNAVSMAGFETVLAEDGRKGLEALKSRCPDLVLLDLHLPEISGDRILHMIRMDDDLKSTTVLLVTADSAMADFLVDKSDYVLQKPISFIQLRAMAERIFKSLTSE